MAEFMQQPLQVDASRKIIHIDMDAFYASIEMRDHPQWRDKPLVIAKDPRKTGGHGVVATANYVARSAGIHSAMAAQKALELSPKAVFKTPDFTLYREVSAQIHAIFHEYTDKIEPIAFDEAYLDVTENKLKITSAVQLAHQLQSEIFEKTHLTCSTGISYNKFLAKLASDYRKPAGVTIVRPADVHDFLMKLPIEKFRGVGKKTVPKMHDLGIQTGQELFDLSENKLMQYFGKLGYILFRRVRGIDDRPVEYQRTRKSIGKERTYNQLLVSDTEVTTQLKMLSQLVADSLKKQQKHGKTVVVKIRYQDFTTITKRATQVDFVENSAEAIYFIANQIVEELPATTKPIRLLGITMTNLDPLMFENITLPLFK
ncbi:DNA polymerase IV [Paucilactobacillus hokkaidonensis JCM 18461]|uniref:DNA polymerase IV n=2 Tax=Paucilactobacillus hokkaidonensis TaxID=1193095 RepID=A0A0A1GYJ6_9LACO|nr:DNA polymerase IV [Paucilactobacillus hokkaidonensis]BAP86043.1 DNA polymerase IV [Paucilactobacillus hokkaidonensis JCM 18461]